MNGARLGRRRLLGALSLAALAAGPLGWVVCAGLARAQVPSREALAERLTGLLRSADPMRRIGRAFLWQRTPAPTRATLVDALVRPDSQAAALAAERWELRRAVRDTVEADFKAVRLVSIGGWMLAESEAELCALTVARRDG
ncbi:MAG TPA: hypothetical protein PLU22_13555 [Polyangiaceae bacterium]|nr:hypothetical protein [Polyangiaceae bacterium]